MPRVSVPVDTGRFGLAVELEVTLLNVDPDTARRLTALHST
jgi:hypothetical protein